MRAKFWISVSRPRDISLAITSFAIWIYNVRAPATSDDIRNSHTPILFLEKLNPLFSSHIHMYIVHINARSNRWVHRLLANTFERVKRIAQCDGRRMNHKWRWWTWDVRAMMCNVDDITKFCYFDLLQHLTQVWLSDFSTSDLEPVRLKVETNL